MAEGEWAGVRDEKLKTNPLQSIPATMHKGMRFKLREAVRKSRSTATASIKATLERLVCSRHRSVAFRKKWARQESRLTEAVLATLKKDPYMDKFVDVTDMQKWVNTLARLTSKESSNSEEIDSGEDLNKASLRKGQPSSPSKSSYRATIDYAMPRESDDVESDDDLTSRDTATQSKPP
ncbi:hypothetical protein H2203_002822 [Taxawa tesnikishii (nom. ined.)]|nr:hypothetical protein H2203_002822 [Dothideales sp. JES 119]